ncbi:MAG: serine hydrolase [Planctomycetes bacterium]|nr:serine hydrolase [Planctomycetota bacterium]
MSGRRSIYVCVLALLGVLGCERASRVERALRDRPERFGKITAAAAEYRVQVLAATVERGSDGRLRLVRDGYRVDAEYFYPASAIKLCAAVAAVQTLHEVSQGGPAVTVSTPMRIAPLFPGDAAQERDASNLAGATITVGHEVRKLFLVSDNQAFNRLYDVVGHRELNQKMHAAGLTSVVVNHRLSESRVIPDQRMTAAVSFDTGAGVVTIPARTSDLQLTNSGRGLEVGTGFMKGDVLERRPMDFAGRNGISLRDLQDALVMVTRPDIDLGKPGFALTPEDRAFLTSAMSEYPGASANPRYDAKEYPNDYGKMFLPGLLRLGPLERWRVSNKVGQAYGFTIENSYIEDLTTGRGLFLAAVIYTNEDGVLNDDKYEYTTVAEPFMADLAEAVVGDWMKAEPRRHTRRGTFPTVSSRQASHGR